MAPRPLVASSVLALAGLVALASAATHVIKAGDGTLAFEPASLTAVEGDILEFHFYPRTHSVAGGDPDKACRPAASGGFYSGFVPAESEESSTVFRVTVNNTDPIYYYCSVGEHCAGGMVGVVNPPDDEALDAYIAAAEDYDEEGVSPDSPFGGELIGGKSTSTSRGPSGTATTDASTATATDPSTATTTDGTSTTATGTRSASSRSRDSTVRSSTSTKRSSSRILSSTSASASHPSTTTKTKTSLSKTTATETTATETTATELSTTEGSTPEPTGEPNVPDIPAGSTVQGAGVVGVLVAAVAAVLMLA